MQISTGNFIKFPCPDYLSEDLSAGLLFSFNSMPWLTNVRYAQPKLFPYWILILDRYEMQYLYFPRNCEPNMGQYRKLILGYLRGPIALIKVIKYSPKQYFFMLSEIFIKHICLNPFSCFCSNQSSVFEAQVLALSRGSRTICCRQWCMPVPTPVMPMLDLAKISRLLKNQAPGDENLREFCKKLKYISRAAINHNSISHGNQLQNAFLP